MSIFDTTLPWGLQHYAVWRHESALGGETGQIPAEEVAMELDAAWSAGEIASQGGSN